MSGLVHAAAAPPRWRFDDHTAVALDDAAGPRATVDPGWGGYLGAHGGYVAAIALRAAAAAAGRDGGRPRSLHVQLLEPVAAGDVALEPRVERTGRSSSTVSLRLLQDGRPVGLASAGFAYEREGAPRHDAVALPMVPGPEACAPLGGEPVPEASMTQYVEYRPAAEPLPLAGSDRAEIRVWMRLAERRPVDDVAATFLVDAAVPALYATLTDALPIPTTDLTCHFQARPAEPSEWVLGVFRTLRAAGGDVLEDGELWSPDGTLLLLARQRRRVLGRRP